MATAPSGRSTDVAAPPCRTLAEYVGELVDRLRRDDPAAFARLRAIVGERRARIRLDRETIELAFSGAALQVTADRGHPVDGAGATDRGTVLDLLDGYAEVGHAVLDGRLEVVGTEDAVSRMLLAIEILLDGAARSPALQQLARDFRADPCREPPQPRLPTDRPRATPWYPRPRPPDEEALLRRLGLLP